MQGLTPKFAEIVARNPAPTETSQLVIHNAHGQSIEPQPGAAFPNRRPHLVIGIFGSPAQPQVSHVETATKWVADCVQSIDDSGETIKGGYMSFTHPSESETVEFFGQVTTERLKRLKKKYDSANVFTGGYPNLM